jgi:hypothetical protein
MVIGLESWTVGLICNGQTEAIASTASGRYRRFTTGCGLGAGA